MSNTELKPCPFCGGKAELIRRSSESPYNHGVWCRSCRCRTSFEKSENEAIEAWNTRRPMERIVEQLESKKIKHDINAESKIQWDLECCNAYNNGIADAIEIVKKEVRDE